MNKEEVSRMREGTDPSSENAEGHPEGLQLEIMNQNHENPEPLMEKTTKTCSRKKTKYNCTVVRRSLRFQNGILPAGNENTELVLEDTTAGESGSAEEQPAHKMHGSTSGDKSLEEKVDYIMQLLEARNSKARGKHSSFCESPESMYKSSYADSQKIEALANENHKLSMKLEIALAKLEAYESRTHAFSEMAEKLKDVIVVSNLSKVTETAVNLSSQTAHGALVPQEEFLSHFLNRKRPNAQPPKAAAKRKKQEKKANRSFSSDRYCMILDAKYATKEAIYL
ncbi:hypothetical protein ACFX2I_040221 [Malus domestica]